MQSALRQFEENIARVRSLGHLAMSVDSLTTRAVDTSDILRAQLVLAVSALDQLIHEVARLGCIEVANGRRAATDASLRYELPLRYVELARNGVPAEHWMGEGVREKHTWLSFQHPDKIADAIRLVSDVRLWERVGAELGMPAGDVKARLRAIVDRRNKIAHEADTDPANPGFRWSITRLMVDESVGFVESVGVAVVHVIE